MDSKDQLSLDKETPESISPSGVEIQSQATSGGSDVELSAALRVALRPALRAVGKFAIFAVAIFALGAAASVAFQVVQLTLGSDSFDDSEFLYRTFLPAARWSATFAETILVILAIVQIFKIYRGIRDLRAIETPSGEALVTQTTRDFYGRPTLSLNWSIRSALRSFALFATYAAIYFSVVIALFLVYWSCDWVPSFSLRELLLATASWETILIELVLVVLMFVQISGFYRRLGDVRAALSSARNGNPSSDDLARPRLDLARALRATLDSVGKFAALATLCVATRTVLSLFFQVSVLFWTLPIARALGFDELFDHWLCPGANWFGIVADCVFVALMIVCAAKIFQGIRDLRALERELR